MGKKQMFHVGQYITIRQDNRRSNFEKKKVEEKVVVIEKLYRNLAIVRTKGKHETYTYWELDQAIKGKTI